jgi:hypothetical protein
LTVLFLFDSANSLGQTCSTVVDHLEPGSSARISGLFVVTIAMLPR